MTIGKGNKLSSSGLLSHLRAKHENVYNNEILSTSSTQKITTTIDKISEAMKSEIILFREEPIIDLMHHDDKFVDPLILWSLNAFKYPRIGAFARSVLCIPAPEAASERTFSHAGLMNTPNRSSLKAGTLEKLVFLHDSKAKINQYCDASDKKRKHSVIEIE